MFNSYKDININWLKNNYKMIHYFGLGFIQLKIDDTYRLHFYTQKLPSIMTDEEVHNHRYSFTSKILKGELTQYFYQLEEGSEFTLQEESCKEGVESDGKIVMRNCVELAGNIYSQGSKYTIHHNTFHRVSATNCITLLERGLIEKQNAMVVRPNNAEKICPFSKKVEEPELWKIVEQMLL